MTRMLMGQEDREQQAVFEWAALQVGKYPELEWMYAIPNGGYRHKATAVILKLTGVKAGVPDIFLPVPKGIYHGLFIEMKVKGNRPTEAQKKYIAYLSGAGYKTAVCYGCDEAIETIKEYMDQ